MNKEKIQDLARIHANQFLISHPDEDWNSHYYGFILGFQKAQELLKQSTIISPEEIKEYRKQGRLSGATKHEKFYKLIAKHFEENYENTDFTILYDC